MQLAFQYLILLPEPSVLRLNWVPDSSEAWHGSSGGLGVVTIIGESFIAQYRPRQPGGAPESAIAASFDILPVLAYLGCCLEKFVHLY